jgi:hypothetical protein
VRALKPSHFLSPTGGLVWQPTVPSYCRQSYEVGCGRFPPPGRGGLRMALAPGSFGQPGLGPPPSGIGNHSCSPLAVPCVAEAPARNTTTGAASPRFDP